MAAGLPMGVRFQPTKLQLVDFFLRIKLSGQVLPPCYPHFLDFDVYTDHPFNILDSTKERRGVNDVNEGFFFSRINKLTPNGKRISRCIKGIGTWSEKSQANEVCIGNRVVGIEKYLKFKPEGRSNNNYEEEDEWIMHKYSHLRNDDEKEDEMVVLCHITKKPDSTKDGDERRRRLKRGQTYAAIMPIDYEASSSKRGRIEYEPSGCNNNSGVINPNQDYMSQTVVSGYQYAYCPVPQANENKNVVDNADNQAYEVDGIIQLTELGDDQVYDMEPLLEQAEHGLLLSNGHIEDIDQFLHEAEQAYWLPKGDSLTAGCDFNNNARV